MAAVLIVSPLRASDARLREGGRDEGINHHVDQFTDWSVWLAHADQHAF
jgi:hypothetical protein